MTWVAKGLIMFCNNTVKLKGCGYQIKLAWSDCRKKLKKY